MVNNLRRPSGLGGEKTAAAQQVDVQLEGVALGSRGRGARHLSAGALSTDHWDFNLYLFFLQTVGLLVFFILAVVISFNSSDWITYWSMSSLQWMLAYGAHKIWCVKKKLRHNET